MLLWHLGATVALVRYAFRDERMDLRFLALGALLPTLLDAPVGIVAWDHFGSVHLVAHSIVFAAAAMTAVLVLTRRGAARRRWMLVVVGILVHLLLDAMWREPATLWWPFLGGSFTASGHATIGGLVSATLRDPRSWLLEALGAGYLAVLARRAGLGNAAARRRLLRTGRVDAPIDRR